jgi:hypothetical protein
MIRNTNILALNNKNFVYSFFYFLQENNASNISEKKKKKKKKNQVLNIWRTNHINLLLYIIYATH